MPQVADIKIAYHFLFDFCHSPDAIPPPMSHLRPTTVLAASAALAAACLAAPARAEEAPPTFDLPAVPVESTPLPALVELDPVGASQQPRWTTLERFSFSDVYVRPAGTLAAGAEWTGDAGLQDHATSNHELAATFEAGLAGGFQVGGAVLARDAFDDNILGARIEGRWAIADWKRGGLNPTLMAAYTEREGDHDAIQFGLLTGGQMGDRVAWASNIIFERRLDDSEAFSFNYSAGILGSVIDDQLAVGGEAVLSIGSNDLGGRSETQLQAGIGPSIAWTPTVGGHRLCVRGAVLLLNGRSGEAASTQPKLSLGVSCAF